MGNDDTRHRRHVSVPAGKQNPSQVAAGGLSIEQVLGGMDGRLSQTDPIRSRLVGERATQELLAVWVLFPTSKEPCLM